MQTILIIIGILNIITIIFNSVMASYNLFVSQRKDLLLLNTFGILIGAAGTFFCFHNAYNQ